MFLSDDNKKHIYYGEVVFTDTVSGAKSFNASPIITATVQLSGAVTTSDANAIVTITGVNEAGFTYRVMNALSKKTAGVPLTGYFYINWMAIGPK